MEGVLSSDPNPPTLPSSKRWGLQQSKGRGLGAGERADN